MTIEELFRHMVPLIYQYRADLIDPVDSVKELRSRLVVIDGMISDQKEWAKDILLMKIKSTPSLRKTAILVLKNKQPAS